MSTRRKITLAVAGALTSGALAALAVGAWRWDRATARAVAQLPDGEAPAGAFTLEQLDGLPDPVARYFRFALTPRQPLVRRARVAHVGDFAMKPGRWESFSSVQHVSVRPPGFVWDASMRMSGLPVRVRDGYLGGEGSMRATVAALVPVVDQHGTPELAASALMRYLAEAPWLPTALLPSDALAWTAIDDSAARATLTDQGITVSADFHFAPSGGIVRLSAMRYRDVDGRGVLTPFEGLSDDYARHGGMMIPTTGEAAWLPPEGRYSYWRGRIRHVEYDFGSDPAPPPPARWGTEPRTPFHTRS